MGFSQDLKDFVKSFEGGMKAAAPTTADARLQQMADDRALQAEFKARGDRTAGQAVTGGGGTGVSIYDDPERPSPPRYNPAGRVPTFARTDIPGNDLDTVVRTVYGEAANEPPEGQRAVAATIFNRAAKAGTSPKYEALKPAQYEPWSRGDTRQRMLSLSPDSPTYQRIYGEVVKAQQGDDPTGGATHFFAPKAQAALGRSVPSWASGEGFRIGNHKFYTLPYSGKGRHGTTSPSSQDLIRRTDEKYGSLPRRAALDLQDDDNEEPVAYAASGGLIPNTRYSGFDDNAGSNPVARDVREGAVDIDQTGSVPEQAPPDTSQPVEPARIATAMDAGLKYIQTKLGLGGSALPEASPRTDDAARALAHNVGAADHGQIEAANRAVDPTGEMPAAQRNAMRLVGMYDFMKERGDEQGAARASAAMLMHSKEIARRAGMMTLAAIDKGDWEGASKSLQSAYDYFPDGKSLRAKAGPAGVEYELVDQTGKGLANGAMTKSEVKQLATDMINGKQWFQMVQAATEPANPVAQRALLKEQALEKQRQALADYDREQPEDDVLMSRMTEKQRNDLGQMDPSVRRNTLNLEWKKIEAERNQYNRDLTTDRQIENRDYKRDWDALNLAIKQNNFDVKRTDVLTGRERKLFLYEKDLDDRNNRFDQSMAARKERDAERAQQLLQSRADRAKAMGIKLTAKEGAEMRADQALEDKRQSAKASIAAAVPEGEYGPTDAQRQGMEAVDVGTAFARHVRAPNAQFDDPDNEAIVGHLKDQKLPESYGPADKMWVRRIASDIRRTGDHTTQDAAMFAQQALSQTNEPRVMPDGSVQIDPSLPAVHMSPESLMALARMRDRMKPQSKPAPGSGGQAIAINPVTGREDARGGTAAPAGSPMDHLYDGALTPSQISALPLPSDRYTAQSRLDQRQRELSTQARITDRSNIERNRTAIERPRLIRAMGLPENTPLSDEQLLREYEAFTRGQLREGVSAVRVRPLRR